MFKQLIERVSLVMRREGVGSVVRKAVSAAPRFLLFPEASVDSFDQALKTDTSGEIPLWQLSIASPNARFGVKYQTIEPSEFLDAIKLLPSDTRDFVFVDLGCGKGRIVMLAAKVSFKRVIGVEFAHELAAVAMRNIRMIGATVEIVEMDATQFDFPRESLVVYMYNPFGVEVMEIVVRRLIDWRTAQYGTAYVIYVNPKFASLFDSSEAFEQIGRAGRAQVWKIR